MHARDYDALVLDLDGTLLDEHSAIRPENREALHAASELGVRVMIATGRSSLSAHPVLEELALDTPAVVFNGAGLYCQKERRMLEERVLSNRTLERTLAHARRHDLLTVLMCAGRKLALRPRDEHEEQALALMTALEYVEPADLHAEFVIRVTLFSGSHASSRDLANEIETAIDLPVYLTDFPLNALPSHRASPLSVVDVHPPCRGKAEALRVLRERYGIDPRRVVAVGDATNDIPMFEAAGLSVAMEGGMPEARRAARRVIGSHESGAIAELVRELFLAPEARRRETA
jgi:Cof subfamily protein (haloacid dehalogenase superfamily)